MRVHTRLNDQSQCTMNIKKLILTNFKRVDTLCLNLDPRMNILVGPNSRAIDQLMPIIAPLLET